MRLIRSICTLLLALQISAAAVEASTITVNAVGDTFAVNFSGDSSEFGYPLSVESDWVVTLYTATSIQFEVTLLNNSPSPTTTAQLTGFGFDTDPDAIGGSTSGTLLFTTVLLDDNSPTFSFDVCVKNGNQQNNCKGNGGNANASLGIGQADTFLLTLTFANTSGGVAFSDFGARMQGIDQGDSAKIFGEPECTNCITSVPEPASMLLFGSGGAALAVRIRRRRRDL